MTEAASPPHRFDHRALVARLYRILGYAVGGLGVTLAFLFAVIWALSFLIPDVPPVPGNLDMGGTIAYVMLHLPGYIFEGLKYLMREMGLVLLPWYLGTAAVGAVIWWTGRELALGRLWARIAAGVLALGFLFIALSLCTDGQDQGEYIAAAILAALPLYPLWVLVFRFNTASPTPDTGRGDITTG